MKRIVQRNVDQLLKEYGPVGVDRFLVALVSDKTNWQIADEFHLSAFVVSFLRNEFAVLYGVVREHHAVSVHDERSRHDAA